MGKVLLIIISAGLIGCTGVLKTADGTKFTHDEIKSIKAGSSTQEDVIALLGQPDQKKNVNGMVKYVYTYKVKKTPTYMGGLITRKSGARTTTRKLEVVIDKGTVYSYKFREEAQE